jgi:2',3'-cyclic-nucleotide 2'-phosphodiesterase (5'-nucleotidase family)
VGERGRFLGLLETEVDKEEKRIESYNYKLIETELGKVEPSKTVLHIVDSLESTIREEMDKDVGVLTSPWIRNSYGESSIGNWITDVMRMYSEADIAFQNSGGIRKDLSEGIIKARDIWEIYPFDNTIVKVTLTGKQLLQLLEWRIANPDDFLQASGIKFAYDSNERRIISAKVNGKSIESEREYTLATNNYVTSHFEKFFGLNPDDVRIEDIGIPVRDLLLQAVNEQKTINSKIENRIMDIIIK